MDLLCGKIDAPAGCAWIPLNIARHFENEGWEVTGRENQLLVEIPGLDGKIAPFAARMPLCRLFWDRIALSFGGSTVKFRLAYGSPGQILIHLLIFALFLGEFIVNPDASQVVLAFGAIVVNLIPVALSWLSLQDMRRTIEQTLESSALKASKGI